MLLAGACTTAVIGTQQLSFCLSAKVSQKQTYQA